MPDQWTLVLDEYEVANLRALLDWVGDDGGETADGRNMNSGDWVNQIRYKLPHLSQLDVGPNPGMVPEEREWR